MPPPPIPADTTTIRLANDQTYTAQQLDIVGKNLRLVGGMTTCTAELDPTARTTLSGAGGARRSIINLRGSTRLVRFERLVLRDGDELLDNHQLRRRDRRHRGPACKHPDREHPDH
jgi:hypothetical protein